MMLRIVIVLLALANIGYFAWYQGGLASFGLQPHDQSETWRLEQQVHPQAIWLATPPPPTSTLAPEQAAPLSSPSHPDEEPPPAQTPAPTTPPDLEPTQPTQQSPQPVTTIQAPPPPAIAPQPEVVASSAAAPPPAARAPARMCFQAGPFTEEQSKTLRNALRNHSLPPDAWELQAQTSTGRWMVYLSQPNVQTAIQRHTELRAQKIDVDRAGGRLEPGLSLGRFSSEEAATRELTRLLGKGLRGARVVQERPSMTLYTLRLPAITAEQGLSLRSLGAALAGESLRPCS